MAKYGHTRCQVCSKTCAIRATGRLHTHRDGGGRVCEGVNQVSGLPAINGHKADVNQDGSIACSCGEDSPVFSATRFRERWWGWHVGG